MSEILEVTNDNGDVHMKAYTGYISEQQYDELTTNPSGVVWINGTRVMLRNRIVSGSAADEAYNRYMVKRKLAKFVEDE